MSIYAHARRIVIATLALGAIGFAVVPLNAQPLPFTSCCYTNEAGGLTCRPKGTNETDSCIGEAYPIKANCDSWGSCTKL